MRVTTLLALLLFLAAASQAAAATKVIRFGKLIDGTGRVFTNAVVVVEDDRVQRVASGNVPIPPGAEVTDLSRYTGKTGECPLGDEGRSDHHQILTRLAGAT